MAAARSRQYIDPNQLAMFETASASPSPDVARRQTSRAGGARSKSQASRRPRTPGREAPPQRTGPDERAGRTVAERGQLDLATAFVAALDDGSLDVVADKVASRLTPTGSTAEPRPDEWLDARRGAAYVGLSLNALHKLTAARAIPFHQDGPGCKLWFRRDELDAWRTAGGARHWKRLRFQNASK